MTSTLELRSVGKTFGDGDDAVVAVTGVDLDIAAGEFVALIGPSGCGKSTLLNLIGGLSAPTSGEIHLNGRRVDGETPPEVARMFQTPVLLDWRTAVENVLLPIEISAGKAAAKRARPRADELLSMVGLDGFGHRYPRELSGGMQQRVAMCRMLIADPEVLLLDEPFGALDEITREHLNVELADIVLDSRKAAILVTHNVAEAVFLADRVVAMSPRPGRVSGIIPVPVSRPRPLRLLADPEFVRITAQVRTLMANSVAEAVA